MLINDMKAMVLESHPNDSRITESPVFQSLTGRMGTGGGNVPIIMFYGLDRASFNQGVNAKFDFSILDEQQPTLTAKGPGAVAGERERSDGMSEFCVRRLTPLECERLQNYPDNWTLIGEPREVQVKDTKTIWLFDEEGTITGKKTIDLGTTHTETQYFYKTSSGKEKRVTDSERYKALGNSIATGPNSFWEFLLNRIADNLQPDERTLGSMFDGIGGFPYIWEERNGKGSCLWASEIEEYPIAVTKQRIGE